MNDRFNGHLCIVFALEHYNPLNMIRAFGENGIMPVYVSVKRRYEVATRSKYISRLYRVDSVEAGYNLLMTEYGSEVEKTGKKPYIVFSDDKSVGFFDLHYEEWKDKFITYNAGRNGRINEFMDKYQIQQLAKKYGFNVLDSYVIGKNDPIPEGLWYPIITKDISPNSGSWKFDVYVCQNEQELKEAIQKIESPLIMIQHFVDKQNEMALEGYTINKGKDMQMTWKYLIQGYYSPYHDVCMFKDKEMEAKLQSMFEEIGFEGIFEVEFLLDKDGTYYFMEINFRASAWNPTCKFAGMPLDYLWVKGMENGYIDPADRKDFEPFTSMSEVIDYGKRVESGMVSLAEWLRDFKDAKCVYIYDKIDRGPWDAVIENWDSFK